MPVPPFPHAETDIRSPVVRRWLENLRSTANTALSPVESPTVDNFASLNADGDVQDSGYDSTSFQQVASNEFIQSDGTSGRVLRQIKLTIDNGTNAATLKCTVTSMWNGDTIAVTDNVAKGATTGNFTLNAGGTQLTVEAAGLAGNCVMAHGGVSHNASAAAGLQFEIYDDNNDIQVIATDENGAAQDMTTLVDTGKMETIILYLTDA